MLIFGNVMEQIFLKTISEHVKDENVIRSPQHDFIKMKLHLINLI